MKYRESLLLTIMEDEKAKDLDSAISRFGAHFHDNELRGIKTREALHAYITGELIHLMLNDMEGLLQLLYRVDVSEQKVKAAFARNDPGLIAPVLADLLIDRELQKAETRRMYR